MPGAERGKGFLVVSNAVDLQRAKVILPVDNIAYISEPVKGMPGNCLIQLKMPPATMPVAQHLEEVSAMFAKATNEGGVVIAEKLKENNAAIHISN